MKKVVFIGRGGQGAKTAAVILAESAAKQGLNIQAFPEYGPERMGAPVKSYVKISKKRIRSFSPILNPNYILLIDESLINIALDLLKQNTVLIINSPYEKEKFKQKFNLKNKVITVDATNISLETMKINKPNLPLIGALLKKEKIVKLKNFNNTLIKFFNSKGKIGVGEKNINAVNKAYESVKL